MLTDGAAYAQGGVLGRQAEEPGFIFQIKVSLVWWLVGLAIYLFLLAVASLFMYGTSRLQEGIPRNKGTGENSRPKHESEKIPAQQLPLPFTPSR
jgi:hypothetical protein